MKTYLLLFLLLAGCSRPAGTERAVKFYQCSMHPWITSEQPGQCTICGMDLVPVYEGEDGAASDAGRVTLMPSTIQTLGVAAAPVVRGSLERTIRVSGVIEDDDTKHTVISAFFAGRIDRVFVDHVGERVTPEQPLALIYSPELLYVVREFQSASRRGSNDPQAAVARQRLVQFGLTAVQVQQLSVGSRSEYGLSLRSPVAGVLVKRDVYAGKDVQAGDVLFEISSFDVMWYDANIYDQDLPWIHIGAKAKVTTPSLPGREFEGTVTLIDPSFDPVTRTTRVRIEVPNPVVQSPSGYSHELPHMAYADAAITSSVPDALLAPRTAVLDTGSRAVAYVDHGNGAYEKRDVRVGRRGDSKVEILGGLAAGESVVTQGNMMIDAEAQMAQPESLGVASSSGQTESAEVPEAMMKQWTLLSEAAAALAADDLAAFNKAGVVPTAAASLADARKSFYEAVQPAVEEALQHPGHVKIYECPMASTSFPGAPQKARWIQLDGPLRNPWFGAKMPKCGSEITP